MKKGLTGLLVVCFILSMAMPVFAALPTDTGIVTSCSSVSGSEFSPKSSIAKKLDKMFAGDIGLYADKKKTKLVDAALGTRNVPNNGRYQYWANGHAGTSCFAYANAFYGKFYDGFSPHDSVNGNHQSVKATGKISYQNFVKWGVRDDAAVYIREGNHSIIVLHYDEDYITYIDGNGDGKGLIAIRKEAWKRGSGSNIYNSRPSRIVQPKTSYFAAGSMQKKQPVPCTEGGSFHDWDEGDVTQKATCKEKGVKVYTCLACQKTKEESIKKTADHTYGQWTVKSDATCTQKGKEENSCTVCGKSKTQTIKALGHKYGKAVAVKAATIYSAGVTEKTCSRCQKVSTTKTLCAYYDKASGITLTAKEKVFPKNAQINIRHIEEPEELQIALQEVTGQFAAYDFSATVKDEPVQPKGEFTVEMEIPEGFGTNLALYAVAEGEAQKIESTIEGKNLTVMAESLQTLAICDLDVAWEPPVEETTEVATEPVTQPTTQPVAETTAEPVTETTAEAVAAAQVNEQPKPENSYILLIAVGVTVLLAACVTVLGILEIKKRKQKEETPID